MSATNDRVGRHYIVEGDLDLRRTHLTLDSRRQLLDWRLEMVAGVGFEPTTFGL